jgi:hypothetical protein
MARHEADHSPQTGAEVKNSRSYISTPPVHFHGVVLSKAHGQLYLLPLNDQMCLLEFFYSAIQVAGLNNRAV